MVKIFFVIPVTEMHDTTSPIQNTHLCINKSLYISTHLCRYMYRQFIETFYFWEPRSRSREDLGAGAMKKGLVPNPWQRLGAGAVKIRLFRGAIEPEP